MSVGWVAAGATLVSGYMGSQAAGDAADMQADAAAKADATQRYMYDQTRADQAPYRDAGTNALMRLTQGLAPGGDFSRRFSQADMDADPVYQNGLQFGLDEGRKGIDRQAAAGGNMLSGATLKALTRFGNDYATTKGNDSYNRFRTDMDTGFNRNASVAGVGQTANAQVGAAGQNMANNISQSQIGVGNARAASAIGGANALSGAMGQGYNMYQGNQLLQAFQRKNPASGYAGGSGYWNDPTYSPYGTSEGE